MNVIRNVLSQKETFALADYVRAEYAKSGLNFKDFAKQINSSPAIRNKFRNDITSSRLRSICDTLDIPNNRPRGTKKNEACGTAVITLTARVAELEEQVLKLSHIVKMLKQVNDERVMQLSMGASNRAGLGPIELPPR